MAIEVKLSLAVSPDACLSSGYIPQSSAYQCSDFSAHIRQFSRGYVSFPLGSSFPPIETLDLVGENRTGTRARNRHLEWIILYLRRHGTADHQPCFRIIGRWA